PGTSALRPAARAQPGTPVLLSDVATLAGVPAEALSGITVLAAASADWQSLDAAAIRAAIDQQADPVWGHLTLLGVECRIRAITPPAAPLEAVQEAAAAAASPTDPTTVRAVIERRLAAAFECEPADLRLEFAERDADLLGQTAIGRTVDVQPTGFSERLPLRITIYEGERILLTEAIRVDVLIQRGVAVAPAALSRGHVLEASDLLPDVRWLPPDVRPLPIDHAPGLVVRTRISAGQPVSVRDVESPILVRRGQTRQVHAVDGAISLQIPARALEDGREGEVIRCVTLAAPQPATSRAGRAGARPPGRGTARPEPREFLARLAAPGLAVAVDADDQPEAESTPPEEIAP
ncbi:MAG: flagellar basal body P-ring formation protein FlgA, partial [Thermomicrobiales bacterium]|nr:flagellar basal body P-ring formation protein FlgA [Thermomicrobiales bacterium]